MGLRNWQQQRRSQQMKMRPRTRWRQKRRWRRKQKILRAWVNVSDGRTGGVFTVPGNWQQRWSYVRNTGTRTQQQCQRRRQRTKNRQHVWGIGYNDRGVGSSTTGPMKISTNNLTTTIEELAEVRRCVQGIRDDNRGSSGSTTGPMDWQWRQIVNLPCYPFANSNTVSSMSRFCLVLILYLSDSFFTRSLQERLSLLQSCGKYFVPSVH